MPVSADTLRLLMEAGMTGDDLLEVVESIDADHATKRSSSAERQARYRARKAEGDVTSDVTGDASHGDVTDPPLDKSSPQTPLKTNPQDNPPSPPKGGHSPQGFDDWWNLFPNKVGKQDARKAYIRALKVVPVETLMAGLRRYAAKTDDRPWCNPATWLNQHRWEDEPAPQPNGTGPPQSQKTNVWDDAFGLSPDPVTTIDVDPLQ